MQPERSRDVELVRCGPSYGWLPGFLTPLSLYLQLNANECVHPTTLVGVNLQFTSTGPEFFTCWNGQSTDCVVAVDHESAVPSLGVGLLVRSPPGSESGSYPAVGEQTDLIRLFRGCDGRKLTGRYPTFGTEEIPKI